MPWRSRAASARNPEAVAQGKVALVQTTAGGSQGSACAPVASCRGRSLGELVPDAVIGALALEHACEVVPLDRDFARFASVAHREPNG